MANSQPWAASFKFASGQGCDLASFLGDWNQSENLSEIKFPSEAVFFN